MNGKRHLLSALLFVLAPAFAHAEVVPAAGLQKAPNVLPTATQAQPAMPSSQPATPPPVMNNDRVLSVGGTNAPAAPSMQPVAPSTNTMNQMRGSIATRTQSLPMNSLPDAQLLSPNTQALSNGGKTESTTTPYIPPELRTPVEPDTNMLLPPLYGWERIVMNDLVMPQNPELVASCGMKKDDIFQFFVQRLQEGKIPLMNRAQAGKLVAEPITVQATPVIVSMEDLVINCTSWVQFQITAEVTVRVPPLMYRRKVPILLWNDGMLVTSAKSTHNGALINAFIDLAMRFRHEWDAQQTMIDPKKLIK